MHAISLTIGLRYLSYIDKRNFENFTWQKSFFFWKMIDEYKDSPFIFTNKLNEPVYDNDGGIVQGYREKDTQFLLNLIHNSSYSEKLFQQLMVYLSLIHI